MKLREGSFRASPRTYLLHFQLLVVVQREAVALELGPLGHVTGAGGGRELHLDRVNIIIVPQQKYWGH